MADGDIPLPDEKPGPTTKPVSRGIPLETAPGDRKLLANAPDDTLLSGMAKNAGTGVVKGLSWLGGSAGDLQHLVDLGVAGMRSIVSDKTTAQLLEEHGANRKRLLASAPEVFRHDWVPDSDTLAEPVLHQTGEYIPQTTLGRIGQIGMAGAVAAISPTAWRRAGQEVLKEGARAIPGAAARPTGQMAVGAGTAAASEEAGRFSPFAGVAAAMLVPSAVHGVGKVIDATTGPATKSAARQKAGEQLLATTEDPHAAIAAPLQSKGETLADVTGDTKHAHAEGTAEKIDPGFRAQIGRQRMDNREDHGNLIDTLADPAADHLAVSKAVDQHVADLTTAHGKELNDHVTKAQEELAKAPQGGDIESLSKRIQESAYGAGRAMRRQLDKLVQTIDPEGRMGVRPVQVREHAESVLPEVQDQVKPTAANPYLEKAASFPEVMPFKQLWSFDKELTGAISQAARSGDANGLRQLRDLKSATKETINKALDNQHEWEAGAVQRGELNADSTLAARLQRQRDEWLQVRNERQATGSGDGAVVETGTSGVSGAPGGSGAPGAGRGSSAGDPGVPGAAPTGFDPGTAERLALFNKGYGVYKDIHGKGPVGAGTKRAAFGDKFEEPLGGTSAFVPGDKGAVNVAAWLRANNSPEAVEALKMMAAQRLRESIGPADTLNAKQLDAWKKKHAPALRAIDEVSPGFSSSFDSAARATEAVGAISKSHDAAIKQATTGAAAKLMGLEHPQDVVNKVGEIMNTRDSARQIEQLMARVKHDPAAVEGVRRSAADWILNNLVVAAKDSAGQPMLSSHAVESFIRKNPDTVRILFGDTGAKVLAKIGEETSRFQRTQGMKSAAVGSDTAQYLQQVYARLGQPGGHSIEAGANMAAMLEGIHDPIMGAKIFGGRMLFSKMKEAVSNWRMKGLNTAQDIYHRALLDPKFGQDLLRETMVDQAGKKSSTLSVLRRMGIALEAQKEGARMPRASGGSVGKFNPAAHAALMVKQIARIRQNLGRQTKPLLDVHDSAIASALESARRVAS